MKQEKTIYKEFSICKSEVVISYDWRARTSELNSFIINLQDKVHYRYLTFKTLAKHLLTLKSETKKADKE